MIYNEKSYDSKKVTFISIEQCNFTPLVNMHATICRDTIQGTSHLSGAVITRVIYA